MGEHGTAKAALDALPGFASPAGVRDYQPANAAHIEAEVRLGRKKGARLLCLGDPDYPTQLADLSDAPPVLWAIGDATLLARPRIAIVGTRRCSSIGERMARQLAAGLGESGFCVASGMARGIDAAAHHAALPFGTAAVLGGGVDVIYPAENAQLHRDLRDRGVILSEQPMGLEPQARHFPQRNRIISGMSLGLIVIEAAAKSGSLITARNAGDQGREVMAVPGHPFDARASGCNMLLRDGATLIRSVDDVLEALQHVPPPASRRAPRPAPAPPTQKPSAPARRLETGELGTEILSRLSTAPLVEDQLIRDIGLGASIIGPALMDLELEGLVIRHPGGLVSLAPPTL